MLYDNINLLEGSHIKNATIASGVDFPSSPSAGELFYISAATNEPVGLYVYTASSEWVRVLQDGEGGGSTPSYVKAPVRAVYTYQVSIDGGFPQVDGVTLVSGDRVLLVGQSNAIQNGIWNVSSSSWTRATDAATGADLEGAVVFVKEGSVYADSGWVCSTYGIVLGTTSIAWTQFTSLVGDGLTKTSGIIAVGAGAGLSNTGNQVGIDLYPTTSGLILTLNGTASSSDPGARLSLANTAVSAGSYTFPSSLTINSKGQITAATSFSGALPNLTVPTFATIPTLSGTSGSINIDWSTAVNYKQNEPTGAINYANFFAPPGPCHLQLVINSDGTSTAQTFTWPASVIWMGAQWTAVANKKAIINFWYDGTNYFAAGMNQA